jgi:thiamine biosynthesis protein ThiS
MRIRNSEASEQVAGTESTMKIIVNGKPMETGSATIRDLLSQLGMDTARVVVERNLEFVPQKMQDSVSLCDGDRIEIVQFVGGG